LQENDGQAHPNASVLFYFSKILKEFAGSCVIIDMPQLRSQNQNRYIKAARRAGYKVGIMSRLLRISQRQLQRKIRRLFGLPPLRWIRGLRLTTAGRLLMKFRSVKRVCFRLGYKQLSHFSRDFKLFHGLTPTDFLTRFFRKKARKMA
jgi:AraC-like DNA-binding protein